MAFAKEIHRQKRPACRGQRGLNEVLAECGEPAPPSTHIPTGTQVTTIERWR